jgi:CIC family chloride channel protein
MAIIIGIIGGLGAVFVRWLIEQLSLIFFSGEGSTHERISNTHWLLILFIPTIGGLLVGLISKVNIPDAKGHGVPEVIYSLNKKGGKISPLVALFKSITSSFTISSGGSVGSEGPMVQIGASIGSTVGQFFKVNSRRMRILVGCGVASGIAAAFNVPIAGALFAIEIILFDFAIVSFTPILISAGIATIITHYFVGDFTEFIVPPLMIVSPYEVISYFVLGALCGIVSFIFIKVLYTAEEFFEKKININQVLKPALGGLIIGFVGIYFPHTMGVGNDSINSAINNDIIWYIALILVFLKILTTSITLGSGGSGGVIAPALFIGAMLGSFYGNIINFYFPNVTAESSAYALVAMGG